MVFALPQWLAKFLARDVQPGAQTERELVYVKLPESLMPLERGPRYEDPIQESLSAQRLGEVTGGGSQLGDPQPDGTRFIEFCGIDVEVTNLDRGRDLLRTRLAALGAPVGTELHFTIDGVKLQDELHSRGWLVDQPRTFLHPGFGV